VQAKFRNAGQVCVSPTRFFVHERLANRFTDRFAELASGLKLGHGLDAGTDVGPLISRKRLDAIEAMTAATEAAGARLVTGGRRPADMNRGYFFQPTVFADLPDEAPLMNDEPFGPLAAMATFSDFDEVVERANGLRYGLASYVFTKDLRRAHDAIEALDTGIVAVNAYQAATAEAPFGGIKHSGFGRENGTQGMLDYLDVKFVNLVAD
jgi:succinate-semialdehyde dehydrogenase/glutarate-semialdehyde dehydrogenase